MRSYIRSKALKYIKRVWVGFSDGKPHVYTCETDGRHCVAVYGSKAAALESYEDVRRAELIIDEPSRKAKRS